MNTRNLRAVRYREEIFVSLWEFLYFSFELWHCERRQIPSGFTEGYPRFTRVSCKGRAQRTQSMTLVLSFRILQWVSLRYYRTVFFRNFRHESFCCFIEVPQLNADFRIFFLGWMQWILKFWGCLQWNPIANRVWRFIENAIETGIREKLFLRETGLLDVLQFYSQAETSNGNLQIETSCEP